MAGVLRRTLTVGAPMGLEALLGAAALYCANLHLWHRANLVCGGNVQI